jgi:hypothetical protein
MADVAFSTTGLLDIVSDSLVPKTTGVEEFAESKDYCNKSLYPAQTVLLKLIFLEEMTGLEEDILQSWIDSGGEKVISPDIRERRDYLRERGYNHFREIQLVGGRRSSKGLMTGIAMAKTMWACLQLGDPHGVYGIDRGKEIYFSCVAASEAQAKEFQFGDLVSTVETCKAFQPYLVKSLETEFRVATSSDLRQISLAKARGNKIQRDIAKLRGKALAANAGTLRGSATMVVAMDEMAHMIPGESKASAEQVYSAAEPSLAQFGIDGMIFLNSSPYTKVGKFYEAYELGMRPLTPRTMDDEPGDPRMFTFEFPSWALFEGYMKYKSKYKQRVRGKEFGKMITVSPDWDPEAVDKDGDPLFSFEDKQNILSERINEEKNPETYKVERRGKFAEVVDAYLNPTMVDQMYAGIPAGTEPTLDGSVKKIFTPIFTNYGQGALNTFKYKFHLDPSSTTAGFGFAIAHIEYFVNPYSGEDEEHVVFDIIKRWDPKAFGGVIRWGPILQEVITYADIFRPFEITFDQHQSAQPIQDLQEKLNARNISCQVYEKVATNELNWKRWEVLKTSIYQGLVHAPMDEGQWNEPTCRDELKFLQQMPTGGKFPKIDKQEIGPVRTKDQADCVAECVNALIGNLMLNRMRDRMATAGAFGGKGGYGIGFGGEQGPIGGPGPPGISGYYSSRQDRAGAMGNDRASLTRSALGNRGGKYRSSRSRSRF